MRAWARVACLTALSVTTFTCMLALGSSAARASPNILVIVTDDQRAGTLGVMPATRRIFLQQGRAFRSNFVTTPLCCPSRASILTGLFAHNHGILTNGMANLPQDLTMQRYLHDAGYKTAIIGKYLNSWPLDRDPPYFDRWALVRPRHGYWNGEFNVNGQIRTLPGYVTDVLAARSVQALRAFNRSDPQPWFVYIAPTAPHAPAIPVHKYADAQIPHWRPSPAVLERDRSDKPPWVRTQSASLAWARDFRARQLRTLMSVDDLVARLFRELRLLREQRRTVAIFLSDNGVFWGEHGLDGKRAPYTEAVSVPMALRWPGHLEGGTTDRRNATNVDVAPTMLAAAGLVPSSPMDGRSLLDSWTRPVVFTEHWSFREGFRERFRNWKAVRTSRTQYIEYYNDDFSRIIFREYYRLTRDPWELRNLLHDGIRANSPDMTRLHRWIRRYGSCSGTSCPGW
jgi:arylsulfatase A-like enzyme